MATKKDNGLRNFLFRGNAVGFRGRVTKPYFQELGEHAVSSTHAGSPGSCSAENRGFSLAGDVRYGRVSTSVEAVKLEDRCVTVVKATIEDLTIGGKLKAEAVVARLESVHFSREYPGRKVARISPAGSKIIGLTFDGKPPERELILPSAFATDPDTEEGRKEMEAFFRGKYDRRPDWHPGQYAEAWVIPNFGVVRVGEWSWVHPEEKHRQHITMLRISLGSPFGGDFECNVVESNGAGWP
jgi:hypothetical protein